MVVVRIASVLNCYKVLTTLYCSSWASGLPEKAMYLYWCNHLRSCCVLQEFFIVPLLSRCKILTCVKWCLVIWGGGGAFSVEYFTWHQLFASVDLFLSRVCQLLNFVLFSLSCVYSDQIQLCASNSPFVLASKPNCHVQCKIVIKHVWLDYVSQMIYLVLNSWALLCLGLSSFHLLSWLLLGFQHLSLDLWREETFSSCNQGQWCKMASSSCSYFRVMLEDGIASCRLGIWVQFEHYPQVLQRILLQYSANDDLSAMTASARIINMHQH